MLGFTPKQALVAYGSDFAAPSGMVEGLSGENKFGGGTVSGASPEPVWDGANLTGITTYTYMTTASTLYLSSDNAGDDQVYEVIGLDANKELQTKQVTANGVTFVAIDGTWLRVFRVSNLGTTDNAGNIYVSDDNTDAGANGIPDTLTNVKAMIIIGKNQTLMALYTVPAGKTAYITQWMGSVGKGDDVDVSLYIRLEGSVFGVKDNHQVYQRKETRTFKPHLKVIEKTDIEMRGQIGAAGGAVKAGFDFYLVDNPVAQPN